MKTFNEKLKAFIEERDWDQFHTPKNLAMGISIEAAEIMEHFHWLTPEESMNPENLEEVSDEMADVFILLMTLSNKLGIDLLEAAHSKLKKNGVKYPADKCRGSAKKHTTYVT